MLDLQNSDNKAITVILWGDKNTGKKKIAEDVCLKIEKDWLLVKVNISEFNGSIDTVPNLRFQILKKLQEKSENRIGNEKQGETECDGAWERNLWTSLPKDKNVFIYIDYVLNAEIIKRLLPKGLILNMPIRVLLIVEDKHAISALDGSVFQEKVYFMQPLCYKEALKYLRENLPEAEPVHPKIIKTCNRYRNRMDVVCKHLLTYYNDDESYSRFCKWIKTKEPTFNELKDYFSCELKFLKLPLPIADALLDICSFFNNWDWNQVACIVGNEPLKKLEELGLLKRESCNVSVPSKVLPFCLSRAQGNRVTNVADLYTSLSEEKPKLDKTKGIWLLQNKHPFHIYAEQLDNMFSSLRVLALGDSTIVKGECKNQFKELRYYQAGRVTHHPFYISNLIQLSFLENTSANDIEIQSKQVPSTLRMVKLKSQNVDYCIDLKKLLPKACKLAELDISVRKMTPFPKEFCELYALKKLILRKSKELAGLHESFGRLRALKILDLSHCEKLTSLPYSFGWLSSLENVNLSYCRDLKDLPDSIDLLSSIQEIDLSYCKSIQNLPKSFVKLSTLCILKLRGCRRLSDLPERFEDLALKELCLEACKQLKALPQRIGKATLSEKIVSLSRCFSLPELSISFINLIHDHVEHLILANCTGLQALPEEFPKQLTGLKTLNLSGCRSLLRLPKRFQKLQCLQKLNLSSCEKLDETSIRLSRLPSLKELNLSNCEGLKGSCLKNLLKVKSLRLVDIHDSPNLLARWNQMERENTVCKFTVVTGRPSVGSPSYSVHVSRDSSIVKGKSPFFNDKWFFVNMNGQPLYPSTLEKGTSVAVLFYRNYGKEVLHALENTLDDLQITCQMLQILHIGRSVSALPRDWAGRYLVYSCDNYEAQLFFEKQLSTMESFDQKIDYAMIVSQVEIQDESKSFGSWTSIALDSLEPTKVDVPAYECLRLKELIETPQDNNMELLQALLLTKETNFLIKSSGQEGIEKLQGKFIFLLISWLDKFEDEISNFIDVYNNLKQRQPSGNSPGFEVVWIPIVNHARGTRALHDKWAEKITWPSIADPWSITPLSKQFLRMQSSLDKLPLFTGVSPKGQLHFENFIPDETGIEAMYSFMNN